MTDIVQSYFQSIGVGKPKSRVVFSKNGVKRFGTPFKELLSILDDRERGRQVDPYELKNISLDMSLYIGEYYVSHIWREFAGWLVREHLATPQTVLDVGCEHGVLSCFYATLWPEANVIGIDKSKPAIAAAMELAGRLPA